MIKSILAAVAAISGVVHAEMKQWGLAALDYVEKHMRLDNGLYAEYIVPREGPSGASSAWSAGVQLSALNAAAALDPARIPAADAYARALDAYRIQKPGDVLGYQPFPVGEKVGDMYYDDNAWLVMTFLDTYHLTGDAEHLRRARDAYAYMASGESSDLGGGIWWHDVKDRKNACSNAPSIVAALLLYQQTKDPSQLALAKRLYAWMPRLQNEDGLYWDAVYLPDERIDKTLWSYNSALMIRANVLFHEITGDDQYLKQANHIADAAEKHWFREDGAITCDGSFAHLLVESMLELHRHSPRPGTVQKIVRVLERLETLNRDGGYPKRWEGWRPGEKRVELLQQASAARAFLFVALQAPESE